MFNGTWLEMRPEDLLTDVSGDGSLCQLGFYENTYPFNIMGSPFFKGYYSIHDTVNGKIGWVPNTDSLKTKPTSGPVPKQQIRPLMPQQTENIVNVITLAVVLCAAYLFYVYAYPYLSIQLGQTGASIVGIVAIAAVCALYYFYLLPIVREVFGVQQDTGEVTPDKLPTPSQTAVRVTATGFTVVLLAKLFVKPRNAATPKTEELANSML